MISEIEQHRREIEALCREYGVSGWRCPARLQLAPFERTVATWIFL